MAEYANISKKKPAAGKRNSSRSFFFQPKLRINQPNDIYEQEADATAERVMNMDRPSPKKTFFSSSSVPSIQKQDDKKATTEAKPDEKKPEEASIGFIDTKSLKKAITEIFGKLPDRYKEAYRSYEKTHAVFIFDLSESRQLASKEIMALWNISNALVYRSYTGYKDVGFGDSVKIAESLSGVSDTYISLASLLLQKDLDKYITDEVPALVKKNLGIILLAGLLIQGGVTAVQYATSSEANFTSLVNPVLTSFTTPPVGFTNPLILDNIADPRFKSPFLKPSGGPDVNYTEQTKDPKVSPTLDVNLGLNLASFGDLYPKTEDDKKKYKGFELYPFFNFTRSYAQQTEAGKEQQDKYFAGIFIGDKGVYTLLEAGVIKGPLGVIETYGKGGLVFRNFGSLRLLSVDAEADQRGSLTRGRINAASQIEFVDNEKWQFILGGTVGGLIPGAGKTGSLDFGASASLYYKDYSADKKDVYKTGGELGFTSRLQDPFDETSRQLFTFKAGLVFKGIVRLGLQYDQISGTGPINTFPTLSPALTLPQNNLTGYVGLDFAPLLFRNEKKGK
jgi:hypothetical protein